jgi:hypothetical protein
MPTAPADHRAPMRGPDDQHRSVSDFSDYSGVSHVAGPGDVTPVGGTGKTG